MSNSKIIFFTIFIAGIHCCSFAQDKTEKIKPNYLKKLGKNSIKTTDYYSAVTFLEKYCEKKPGEPKGEFLLAEAYRLSRNYPKAEDYYLKTVKDAPDKFKIALFYAGQMQKMQGKYKEATENFTKFIKQYIEEGDAKRFKKLANNELMGCKLADSLSKTEPPIIYIEHLSSSVNNPHLDAAPFPINDSSLLFSSLRMEPNTYFNVSDTTHLPVTKFYLAGKQNGEWEYDGLYDRFNMAGKNVSNGVFSPDKKRFFFTVCERNYLGKNVCNIYLSKKTGSNWEEPQMIEPMEYPKYSSTQPSPGIQYLTNGTTREVLFFVSDRPGSKGGTDIWYSVYDAKRNIYKSPKNAGGKINTVGDEVTPYYDFASNIFYFSSNGHAGIGGFDIFKTTGQTSKWADATNMGLMLNTSFDDYYYKNLNEDIGFFVSNRTGSIPFYHESCCDDIFAYRMLTRINMTAIGKIFPDTASEKNPCDRARIALYKKIPNEPDILLNSQIMEGDCDFKYILEPQSDYILEYSNDGFFTKKIPVTTRGKLHADTFAITVEPTAIPKTPILLKNVYFEFNSAALTPRSKDTLNLTLVKIMSDDPTLIIEISAHTDNIGTDAANQSLSQKRAESVVKYLVSKGVAAGRLQAKGYGESKPIVANQKPDGSDNPDGRAVNRRVEFKVVGTVKTPSGKSKKEEEEE